MQIPVLLDRSRRESLTTQLTEQLRDSIRQGRIPPSARLPSSRRLSEQLEVSRNTVIRAYDTLIVEGYAETRPASGIFVADPLPMGLAALDGCMPGSEQPQITMPTPAAPARMQNLVNQNRTRISLDFFPGRPSPAQFPLKTWRRLLQGLLAHGGSIGLSQYSDPAGLPALRSAIAHHLSASRGIIVDPGRVIVTTGIQEGISLAARMFLRRGQLAAIEDPCYQGAAFAIEATGADVAAVPVDAEGLIPSELPKRPAALLYLTPSHQYPTGALLSQTRRQDIIAWARKQGCYILEDDYDSDFRYEGSPLPAMAAQASDCTIYLGTFSKSLGAGLRLGYMVVPTQLAESMTAAKALLNNGNPWLDQATLAEFIRSNSYSSHLMRVRAHYRENRDNLLEALRRNFGDVSVSGEAAGLHILWQLPPGVPDAPVVETLARRARIGVYGLASGGAHAVLSPALAQRALILGYAALLPRQIEQGIARLSDVVDDAIDDPNINVSDLFAHVEAPPARRDLDSRFRRQPALAARRKHRASLPRRRVKEVVIPMATVTGIYRYPIKGLSGQLLSTVALDSGRPFPQDRIFALARPGAPIDRHDPKWAKKGLFVMLMLDEGLASVSTHLDLETSRLTVMQGNRQVVTGSLTDPGDRSELETFFWKLTPALPAAPALVRSRDGHFMDKPDNVISLINLATIKSLEQQWGYDIDPLRFRANIYIDGAKPWEEFDWIGSDVRIGDAVFTVDRKNGRCGATNVNPVSGRRDLDIPGSLRAAFGHKNLGVYLIVREGGRIAVGDKLDTPGATAPGFATEVAAPASPARSFICRGCYFIYEEEKGLPDQAIAPHTPFAAIPAAWRCPDCGTDKSTFRPYVAARPSRISAP